MANTGVKSVPSPNPEKKVKPAPAKAVRAIKRYSEWFAILPSN
jgi:hypothetical protein